jgi:hypothetical protein
MSIPAPHVIDTHAVTVRDPINVHIRSASPSSPRESDDEKSLGLAPETGLNKHDVVGYQSSSAYSSEDDLINKSVPRRHRSFCSLDFADLDSPYAVQVFRTSRLVRIETSMGSQSDLDQGRGEQDPAHVR